MISERSFFQKFLKIKFSWKNILIFVSFMFLLLMRLIRFSVISVRCYFLLFCVLSFSIFYFVIRLCVIFFRFPHSSHIGNWKFIIQKTSFHVWGISFLCVKFNFLFSWYLCLNNLLLFFLLSCWDAHRKL